MLNSTVEANEGVQSKYEASFDSDIMEDSSEDEVDEHSIDVDSKANNADRDDEEYANFLNSVFCDDDDGAKSTFSLTDDDDEEEYRPQFMDSNDEDDDDDEGDDDGLIKVARKELVDLVDGCWQTIAGERLQFPPSNFDGSSSQARRGVKRNRVELHSVEGSNDSHQIFEPPPSGEGEDDSIMMGSMSSSSRTTGNSPRPALEKPVQLSVSAVTSNPSVTRPKGPMHSVNQSLISNLVRQIFSGEKPSTVCVEGMPVDAIRKLVARQMSMASQLLIQMLLSSEDRSNCFSSCYTSLMELSNFRENALKKAALLQMNMKNLRAAAYQRAQLNQHGHSVSYSKDGHYSSDSSHRGTDSSPAEMRLTRAVAGRQSKELGLSMRSTSLFNVPMLADITELFGAIDLSRREMKTQIATSAAVAAPTLTGTGSDIASVVAADADAQELFRRRSDSLIALKNQIYRMSTPPESSVAVLTKNRIWGCLMPSPHFPLGEDMMRGTDPSSLVGRSLFTPAEDDLLLRGIIKHGEDSWGLIRQQYLPSKEDQLLQFRFRQMTAPTAKEASKFKRYTALEKNSRGRDKWSHEEDLDLLRGYQIYGDKWPLISIFFFPNRCRRELKTRWQAIQKLWERKFSGNLSPITFQTELPPTSKMLLHFLKETKNTNHTESSPSKSPARQGREGFSKSYLNSDNSSFPPNIPVGNSRKREKAKTERNMADDCNHDVVNGDDDDYQQSHSYGGDNDDDVEEDALLDSDNEEENKKDLDWHLGRLTSTPSQPSQWKTFSSAALPQHSKRKGHILDSTLSAHNDTSYNAISRAGTQQQSFNQHQFATQQQGRPLTQQLESSYEKNIMNDISSTNGLRSSSSRSIPTYLNNSITGAGNEEASILNVDDNMTISDEYGSELQCDFTNFSNITMMLETAKAQMGNDTGRVGVNENDMMPSLKSSLPAVDLLTNPSGETSVNSMSATSIPIEAGRGPPSTAARPVSTATGATLASGQSHGLFAAVMRK